MDNTVGSYSSKHWQKKWMPLKQTLFLTPEQQSVLVGSLLGDGTLRVGEGAITANLKIEHGIVQKEYVWWKYHLLKPWVLTEPKKSYRYRQDGERYEKSWWFRTVRHPILMEFRKLFYRDQKKVVPPNIAELLDPQAVAVWIMDDGSYQKNRMDLSTYSFTFSEIHLLQQALSWRFGIESRYYKDRNKGYRMWFNKESTQKLVKIVRPYIIESMYYKIGAVTP